MRHALGAVLVVSIVAGRAHAQSQSGNANALAEQLFNQARDLAKANQWAEACPKFEASLRYDPVLGTRLNLATCYEHVGKIASAWGLYRESIELARKAGDTKRAEYAQKQATALEPRLPKLAIAAPPAPPAGLVVKRDDTLVDAGALGVALYVDPGTHKVTASAPGFEAFAVTVTLIEGKTETLAIPTLVATPVADTTKPAAARLVTTEPAAPASRTRKYVALGLGAAGVAAVGVSLVFGAKANSSFSDAKSLCGASLACSDAGAYSRDKQLVSNARSSATTSTVLMIGGGAAIAAGVVVLLIAPRTPERATARIVPVTHDGGAGLALTGTF
jgi:tetratricopeptide (TPR) repeat protein